MAGRPPMGPSGAASAEGKISNTSLAEAVANGQVGVVKFLCEESKVDIDEPGKDGTTPICAAALWGNDQIVTYLLDKGGNIDAPNKATSWTALHAATFQEHGKVVMLLINKGANVDAKDHKGRTPKDYASISESVWPFFEAKGCVRSTKEELVERGIIKRVGGEGKAAEAKSAASSPKPSLVKYSRPGSSYVRCSYNPLRPLSAYVSGQQPPDNSPHRGAFGMNANMPGSDPLGDEDEVEGNTSGAANLNFNGLSLA